MKKKYAVFYFNADNWRDPQEPLKKSRVSDFSALLFLSITTNTGNRKFTVGCTMFVKKKPRLIYQ